MCEYKYDFVPLTTKTKLVLRNIYVHLKMPFHARKHYLISVPKRVKKITILCFISELLKKAPFFVS